MATVDRTAKDLLLLAAAAGNSRSAEDVSPLSKWQYGKGYFEPRSLYIGPAVMQGAFREVELHDWSTNQVRNSWAKLGEILEACAAEKVPCWFGPKQPEAELFAGPFTPLPAAFNRTPETE